MPTKISKQQKKIVLFSLNIKSRKIIFTAKFREKLSENFLWQNYGGLEKLVEFRISVNFLKNFMTTQQGGESSRSIST